MIGPRAVGTLLTFAIAACLAGSTPAQTPAQTSPRLEAVAETRLLMEAIVKPNFNGLERILAQPPTETQAWAFARGQALLVAETGNLLMLRPPRTPQAQPAWFERSAELRRQATELARGLARRDYLASRSSFVELANSCNRCHRTFRIPVEITPFAAPKSNPMPNPER